MRRLLAATLAMLWIVSLTISTAAQCAGWESSPIARAACCHAAGHSCPQRGGADSCCGQTEQSRQSFTSTVAVALVKPVALTSIILDLLAAQRAHAALVSRVVDPNPNPPPLRHESPHLVFSVFRI